MFEYSVAEGEGMSERKIVIPEGMLDAAFRKAKLSLDTSDARTQNGIELAVEAALKWLGENPIVPTEEQHRKIIADWNSEYRVARGYVDFVGEWQRRMFIAPDPDEEIKDLLFSANLADSSTIEIANNKLRDAYRRGLKKREVGE